MKFTLVLVLIAIFAFTQAFRSRVDPYSVPSNVKYVPITVSLLKLVQAFEILTFSLAIFRSLSFCEFSQLTTIFDYLLMKLCVKLF